MRLAPIACRIAVAGTVLAAADARAADAAFQAFFLEACGAPSGALATRCAETPGGLGDLSGDSESSLNPSQNLSQTSTATGLAQARSKAARERGDHLREGEQADPQADATLVAGPFSLLFNVHGLWFERDVGSNAGSGRGYEGDSGGLEIGLDYRLSERAVVGALAGIEQTRYDFDAEAAGLNFVPASHAGSVESDATYLTLFGSFGLGGGGFVEASAGYERHDGTYRRNAVFQEATRTRPQVDARVVGDAMRTVGWASINAGFDLHRKAFGFGPYLGLTATRSEVDAYTERDPDGSGLNMRFDSAERDSLLGHAGLRASHAFSARSGVFVPQLRLEYQREFDDDAPTVVSRYVLDTSGTEYRQAGGGQDEDSVVAGFSLSAILPGGWTCFADYSVLLGHDEYERERAALGLRVEF